ncbi:MAG: hypothetical protein HY298_08890 [Verrucomicrobia bacterium]|nr:hypothetical protein [Verrucomicrobiota bacterium]
MIGSRILFSGYGVGFKTKPLHAGFLGQDTLIVHNRDNVDFTTTRYGAVDLRSRQINRVN